MLKVNTSYSWMNPFILTQLKQKLKTLENMSVISCVEGATERVNNLVIAEKMVTNWSLVIGRLSTNLQQT